MGKTNGNKTRNPPRYKNSTYWVFKCDCGKKTEIPIDRVIEGKTRSCGCLLKEHYQNDNPTQSIISEEKQKAIADLIKKGWSPKKIAIALNLSTTTVNKYAKIIRRSLKIKTGRKTYG